MTRIRILADDLTGALDTAAAFAGEIPVFLAAPSPADALWADATVSVLATPTRDVPPATLPAYLQPALDWFCGGDIAYKKVDSLLRGNTFAEIAWLNAHGRFRQTIFAPAFPGQGRITTDNRQWVVTPKPTAHSQPTPQPVAAPLREAFAELGLSADDRPDSQAEVWIPDVLDDADLDRIAARPASAPPATLWCGSAGLAQAIARHHGLAPIAGARADSTRAAPHPVAGPTVLISASFQPVLYAQWEILKAALPAPAIAERARPEEIAAALAKVRDGAAEAWFDLSPRREMTPSASLELLRDNIGALVRGLPRPGQLMVVGGDTLLGICRATGARALLAGASIRNGWGRATLVGGDWDGTPCYSRSGAFGPPDDLKEMRQQLSCDPNLEKGRHK